MTILDYKMPSLNENEKVKFITLREIQTHCLDLRFLLYMALYLLYQKLYVSSFTMFSKSKFFNVFEQFFKSF